MYICDIFYIYQPYRGDYTTNTENFANSAVINIPEANYPTPICSPLAINYSHIHTQNLIISRTNNFRILNAVLHSAIKSFDCLMFL